MKKNCFFCFACYLLIVFSVVGSSCVRDRGMVPVTNKLLCDSLNVKYLKDIQPIIQSKCALPSCHVSGTGLPDFTTYNNIKPYADNERIRARAIDMNPSVMPPAGQLPDSSIKKLDCWLKSGAPNN